MLPNQQVKEQNLRTIRRLLWQMEQATKGQLAQESGLSVVTVGALMRELVACGEALEDQQTTPENGRPAQMYRFCYDHRLALTLTILEEDDQDMLTAIVVNLRGDELWRMAIPLAVDTLKALLRAADEARKIHPAVAAIGIGLPGQAIGGKVVVGDRLDLLDMELAAFMQSRYHCPVWIENDVNAAAFAYARRSSPDPEDCTVIVYFPLHHPPGAGILLGQQILRGMDGMSGELKGLPLSIDWIHPPQPFEMIMCDIAQTITALLAPRRLIFYRQGTNVALLTKLMDRAWEEYNLPVRPQVVVANSLSKDYEQGVRDMALSLLWNGKG